MKKVNRTMEPAFHYFPQLPAEIRQEIWTYCLPHRVCQIDQLSMVGAFDRRCVDADSGRTPCRLSHTTWANKLPPVVTRVCRESRQVAFRTGRVLYSKDRPHSARYQSGGSIEIMWEDPKRDMAHTNWTLHHYWHFKPRDQLEKTELGIELPCLLWHTTRLSGVASMMLRVGDRFPSKRVGRPPYLIVPSSSQREQELALLKRFPRLLVVMRVVIIHAPIKVAVETGCFGLLGDAPVQVIDIAERAMVKALINLAENSESQGPVVQSQMFEYQEQLCALGAMEAKLRTWMERKYHNEELTMMVRPAIMFRLCTQNCNDPVAALRYKRSQAQKRGWEKRAQRLRKQETARKVRKGGRKKNAGESKAKRAAK